MGPLAAGQASRLPHLGLTPRDAERAGHHAQQVEPLGAMRSSPTAVQYRARKRKGVQGGDETPFLFVNVTSHCM